jgi:zinc protease
MMKGFIVMTMKTNSIMHNKIVSLKLMMVVLSSLLASMVWAQQPHAIPVDSAVKIGKLPNGLTYYIRKNSEPKNRSELYLVVRAGSNMEDDDQRGLAHFSEHMAFNGTKDFPKNQLVDYLQKAGVRFGADLNAYTSFDETVYQLPLPTDDPELFKKGFTILSNWAGAVSFDAEEVEKERGIIVEEDRLRGKDAGERMRKQIFPVLFHESRYAERLPIGSMDIVKSFKPETIKRFYKDWYRPNLQAVIAVGDFDVEAVEKLIRKNFSGLKNPRKERTRETYTIPMNDTPLVKVATDPEFSYTVAYIFFKQSQVRSHTTDDLKRSAMIGMINGMFGARIQEIMEGGNAPFVHASGYYGPYYGGLGGINSFFITTVAKEPELLKGAIEGVLAEVNRVHKFGFTETELSRAKKNFWADLERQFNERRQTSSSHYVNAYVDHFIKGQSIPGIEFLYQYYKTELANISLTTINEVARAITTNKSTVAVLEGLEANKTKLPDEKTYLSWIQQAGAKETAPYVDNVVDQPLLSTLPIAGKVVGVKEFEKHGVTELVLSNGITVVLKPTEFKHDEILFSSSSTGGTSLASEKDYLSASIAADVVSSSGVGAYDKSQLTKLLSGKVVGVTPYIDEHYEGINGYSTPKDITTAFQLIYLHLTQPRIDSNVFKMIKENYKVNLTARPSFPGAVYQDTISAVMSNYHKRNAVPSVADVEMLDLQNVYRLYKDRFADNDDLTFFFVGNFSVEQLTPYLETYLASLPTTSRTESYRDLNIRPIAGKVSKNVFKGLEDKASVSLFLHQEYTYDQHNNLMLDVLTSALRIKLIERLREKESGVYTPGVHLSYGKVPYAGYTFHINFSCASANVDKLIAATLDELEQLRKNGVSAVDLEKFKAEERRQIEIRLRENNFWMNYLSDTYTRDEAIDRIQSYPGSLEAITVEDTQKAAALFLNDVNFKRVVLLPEMANGARTAN